MCIRDSFDPRLASLAEADLKRQNAVALLAVGVVDDDDAVAVSYTHLRAHETVLDLVCRLLLEKKNAIKLQTTLLDHSPTTLHCLSDHQQS